MILCTLHQWTEEDGPSCRYCAVAVSRSFQTCQEAYRRENAAMPSVNQEWIGLSKNEPSDRWSWREVAWGCLAVAVMQAIIVLGMWLHR